MLSTIRIFISSPGDVAEERQIAGRVIEQVQGKYWSFVRLDDVFWEDRAVRATAHYQDELVEPASCEIVVGILWSRLGSPLPERFRSIDGIAPTGTEWELEGAFAAYEKSLAETGDPAKAKPDILIYRREPPPARDDGEARAQLAKLESYFGRHFFHDDAHRTIKRAFLPYRTLESFEDLFRKHLEELVLRLIPGLKAGYEPPPISGCPYKGLDAFGFDDADRYFGRNRQIREVQQQLVARRESGPAFVLVYGASGHGKSSLMRAGLAPAIMRPGGLVDGATDWRRLLLQPAQGQGPLVERLARELGGFLGNSWDTARISRQLADAEDYVFVAAALQEMLEAEGRNLLIQIDQLEEVFAEGIPDSDQDDFFRALFAFCSCARVWGLATMRSEFFPRIAAQRGLKRLVGRDGGYILPPPDAQMLSEIIRFPALAARLQFERSTSLRQVAGEAASAEYLSDQIYNDAKDSPDALPLLEFCLTLLYEETRAEGSDLLTWASYERIGGLRGAIATVADETFESLRPVERSDAAVAALFGSLVRVDPASGTSTRRRASLDDLRARSATSALLDAFLSAKLLVSDKDGATGGTVVFLAHECLLSHWGRLSQWIDDHRADLAAHQRLIEQTEFWEANGRNASYLLAEGRLAEAQRVVASGVFHLTPQQETYLNASVGKARRRLRFFKSAAAVFAVVALAAGVLGWLAKLRTAEATAALGDTQVALVESRRNEGKAWLERARRAAQADPADAFTAAMMAGRAIGFAGAGRERAVAEDAGFAQRYPELISETTDPELVEGARADIDRYMDSARRLVWATPATRHHSSLVSAEVFTADGEALYSMGSEGDVYRWNLKSGARSAIAEGGSSGCHALALSPDGAILAIGTYDAIHLRDGATGELLVPPLTGHWQGVVDLAFSPDGRLLASLGGSDGTVRLWATADGSPVGDLLRVGCGSEGSLAFSADGQSLTVGGGTGVEVFGIAGGARRVWLAGEFDETVRASVWSRDSTRFAVATDGRVRLWQIGSESPTREPVDIDFSGAISLAFDADGQTLAVSAESGTIAVVATASGERLGEIPGSSENRPFALAFSADGRTLAAGMGDRTVRLWDVAAGAIFGTPLNRHSAVVNTVAYSADGRVVAEGRSDGRIRLWNPTTGEMQREMVAGKLGVRDLAFSPDGRTLAAGSFDRTVRTWDLTGEEPVARELEGHEGTVASVAFTPDGRTLASGSSDRTIRLWDVATGEPSSVPLEGHSDEIRSVAISADGSILVSGGLDQSVRVWDLATGEPVGQPLVGHTAGVLAVAVSPATRRVATAGADKVVRLWDPGRGTPVGEPMVGHTNTIQSLAFSPDGRTLASGSNDSTVRFWDVATGGSAGQTIAGRFSVVFDVAFAPDGRSLATANNDGTLKVWDLSRPAEKALTGHAGSVGVVAIAPSGRTLVSGGDDATIRLWDLATGQPLCPPLEEGHGERISCLAISPDGRTLASGSGLAFGGEGGSVRLWDLGTGEAIGDPLPGHTAAVAGLGFSPDGGVLASCGWDSSVRFWEVEAGRPARPPLGGHSGVINVLAFSPDGTTLATGGQDNVINFWDLTSDAPEARPLVGHLGGVSALAFSPDGAILASGSWDTSVRFWDVATGNSFATPVPQGGSQFIVGLNFSLDGRTLTATEQGGIIRQWDALSGQPVTDYRRHYPSYFYSTVFSPDDQILAAGTLDGTVYVYPRQRIRPLPDLAVYLADGLYQLTETVLQPTTERTDNLLSPRSRQPIAPLSSPSLATLVAAANWARALAAYQSAVVDLSLPDRLAFAQSLIATAAADCLVRDSVRAGLLLEAIPSIATAELVETGALDLALFGLASNATAAPDPTLRERFAPVVLELLKSTGNGLPLPLLRTYAEGLAAGSTAKRTADLQIASHPDAPLDALILAAWSLVTFEDYPEAIAAFQRAAEVAAPGDPPIYLLLGQAVACWLDEQQDEAIAAYRQLIATDPKWSAPEAIQALDWQESIAAPLEAVRLATVGLDRKS